MRNLMYRDLKSQVLWEVAANSQGSSAASICCGRGSELIVLGKVMGKESNLFGVDYDAYNLSAAFSRISKAGIINNVTLQRMDAKDYRPTGIDYAVCCFGISYIQESSRAINLWLNSLNDYGKLLIVDWDIYDIWKDILKNYSFGYSKELKSNSIGVRSTIFTKESL